jgi:hypothetical protein
VRTRACGHLVGWGLGAQQLVGLVGWRAGGRRLTVGPTTAAPQRHLSGFPEQANSPIRKKKWPTNTKMTRFGGPKSDRKVGLGPYGLLLGPLREGAIAKNGGNRADFAA